MQSVITSLLYYLLELGLLIEQMLPHMSTGIQLIPRRSKTAVILQSHSTWIPAYHSTIPNSKNGLI
jgi:hypothetical protein